MRTIFVKKLPIFVLVLALTLQTAALYVPKKALAAFDANTVVSDSVFENTGSMSAAQIDNFLNGNGASCIRQLSGFVSPDPLGYSAGAYRFGGNVTAGQAIFNIAKHYNVNPQVILTTLQKEQSLVTGSKGCHYDKPNPDDAAQVFACDLYSNGSSYRCTEACPFSYGGGCMNVAMGYGCPSNCNVDVERFNFQISGASWLLRFSEKRATGVLTGYTGYDDGDNSFTYPGPMTPGFRQRVAGGASTYYDGTYTTKDGVSVNITNGATASLYTYTPFVNGNRSFQNIFENTFAFGSAVSGNCIGTESPLPYVQRYYNPRTFEHFYSAYSCDTNFLVNIGYILEGPVFNTTLSTNPYATPIYRYYNPSTGMHMWSTDGDPTHLVGTGYQVEAGIVFYVDSPSDPNAKSVYRFYNPRTYLHLWASSAGLTVQDLAVASQAGYVLEGPAFYTQ